MVVQPGTHEVKLIHFRREPHGEIMGGSGDQTRLEEFGPKTDGSWIQA